MFEWNHHRIRYSNMAEVPHGVPEVMYNFPEIHGKWVIIGIIIIASNNYLISGANDYKYYVSEQLLCEVDSNFCEEVDTVCPQYKSVADFILAYNNISIPTNFEEALEVYFFLIQAL